MSFQIKFESEARLDIQEAINWYNQQQKELGKKFYLAVHRQIDHLTKHPYFEIRYDNVRCLPIEKFPFMIHFTIDESKSIVIIRAVFHTSLDSDHWAKRKI